MGGKRWFTGLVILAMFAAVWVPQWIAYESTAARLRGEIVARKNERAALEVTAEKEAEFHEQTRLLAAKLERLAEIIPPVLDADAFVARYRDACRAVGFTILDRSTEESVVDEHVEAMLHINVTGDRARLPELFHRTLAMTRLVSWRGWTPIVSSHDGQATTRAYKVEFTIYAWPSEELTPTKPCIASPEGNAIWTFSRQLAALHQEGVRLCEEIERFEALREEVDAFQQRKKVLEDQIAFIDKVRPATNVTPATRPSSRS